MSGYTISLVGTLIIAILSWSLSSIMGAVQEDRARVDALIERHATTDAKLEDHLGDHR